MNRQLRRVFAAGALAVLLAAGAAAPAGADTTIEVAPEVSWDGEAGTWSQEIDEPMFSVSNMVPCNTEVRSALVRNGGTREAHLTVTLQNAQLAEGRSASDPFYQQIHLQMFKGTSSDLEVDDTIPNLVGRDIVLFDGDVAAGQEVPVRAQYAWMYGNACGVDPDNAANGAEGPWMDFKIVATMRYVIDSTPPPSTTAAPTSTPAPSDTVIPPTTVTVTTTATDGIDAGVKSSTRPAGGGGGDLPSTGLGTPVMALGLTGLVLLALGLPLILRRRKDKRSHA